jgi:hypothetical protein
MIMIFKLMANCRSGALKGSPTSPNGQWWGCHFSFLANFSFTISFWYCLLQFVRLRTFLFSHLQHYIYNFLALPAVLISSALYDSAPVFFLVHLLPLSPPLEILHMHDVSHFIFTAPSAPQSFLHLLFLSSRLSFEILLFFSILFLHSICCNGTKQILTNNPIASVNRTINQLVIGLCRGTVHSRLQVKYPHHGPHAPAAALCRLGCHDRILISATGMSRDQISRGRRN